MATKSETGEVVILEMNRGVMEFCIVGTSPMICNRMSEKAKQQLLAPAGRKSAVEKASSLKHNPLQEFRDSPYRLKAPDAPTLLAVLPTMFKQAMATAALRMPGVRKSEIGQLVSVEWDRMPLWGVPKLFMSVTRSADINKTPDVRTRAILPEWACVLTVSFMKPALREQSIANLLAAAGYISGIGDWRQEKGSGAYGAFKIVSKEDADLQRIVQSGARVAQEKAMEAAEPYDDETSELLVWYEAEAKRRGFKVQT
jgi:hypothetical protein